MTSDPWRVGSVENDATERDRDAILILDRRTATSLAQAQIIYASAANSRVFGLEPAALIGHQLSDHVDTGTDGGAWSARGAAGSRIALDASVQDLDFATGADEQRYALVMLRKASQRLESAPIPDEPPHAVVKEVEPAEHVGSFEYDHRSGVLSVSTDLRRILGLSDGDALASFDDLLAHVHPEDMELVRRTMSDARRAGARYSMDHRVLRADGLVRWVAQRGQTIVDERAKAQRTQGTMLDITERKEAEDRLVFLAHHDALTGLPNRNLLIDRLRQATTFAQRNKRLAALLFLDLDRFKRVNDTYGHIAGDRLLCAVARRLRASVRAGDVVARPGGDEFIIVLSDVHRVDVVAKLAQKIADGFAAPFETDDGELVISTSIGISIYPFDGDDAETLIRRADSALYQAKERGRGSFQFFTPNVQAAAMSRLALENELRRAITQREFTLNFQPIVDVASGAIVGAEALVRWDHPARGRLEAAQFVGVAEEAGLLVPIGEWVAREACAIARSWARLEPGKMRLTMNLSTRQLAHSKTAAAINAALRDNGLAARVLEVEVPESATAREADAARRTIEHLTEMGVRVAIDAFGAGASSLERLRHYPASIIKIDREFIRNIDTSAADRAIADGIVTVAHGLGHRVVAVGVETQDQLNWVSRLACDEMQGFLVGPPLSAAEFKQRLTQR